MKNPFSRPGSLPSYFLKVFELVLTFITVFWMFNFFFLIVSNIEWLRWMLPSWYWLFAGKAGLAILLLCLLGGCPILAYYWQRKEREGSMSSERSHAVTRGAIRWGLAFALIFFSWVFFIFPLVARWSQLLLEDMTTATVSSNYMFEFLLVRSQAFRAFLSGSLMLGGLLLFFKRTTFLGLAVAIFTTLLLLLLWLTTGSFSEFNFGYVIGGYVMLAAGYLLLLQWSELRNKLMGVGQTIVPVAGMRFRWAMLLIVVASAGFVYKQSLHQMNKTNQLMGKWKVKVLERNGAALPAGAWMTDAAAWTTVYIDGTNQLRFCSNPYKFDQGASFYSTYELDASRGRISVGALRNMGGPIQFQVEGLGTNELSWHGKVGRDDIRLVLARDL